MKQSLAAFLEFVTFDILNDEQKWLKNRKMQDSLEVISRWSHVDQESGMGRHDDS